MIGREIPQDMRIDKRCSLNKTPKYTGNMSKSRQAGLHQIKKLFHNKGNKHSSEMTTQGTGKIFGSYRS